MKNIKYFLAIISFFCFTQMGTAKDIVLEAENATLLNGSTIVNSSLCSGGRKVGNIGSSDRNGGILINFSVESAGQYNINIYYLAAYTTTQDVRNLYLQVNNMPRILVNCPSTGSWDIPNVVTISTNLQEGANTIQLDNPYYYGADIDMVIIEKPTIRDPILTDWDNFKLNDWELNVNTKTGISDILYQGKILIPQTQAKFYSKQTPVYFEDLKNISIADSFLNDTIGGQGKKIVITGTTFDEKILVTQSYYLYSDKNYILTDFNLSSADTISSNYLSPINSTNFSQYFNDNNYKALWVPYDNDKWIRYNLVDFGTSYSSYEVTAFLNNQTRQGLVIGSVEHDVWKTGIRVSTSQNGINRIEAFGGASSNETRDVLDHGAVKGHIIKSPKIMIGIFSDWRRGMETYADVNEAITHKLSWNKGKPFLWNSWGALQTNLSYSNATEVAQYFADVLMPRGFENDNTVYIDLDSYWDNISYQDLIKFCKECKARGQNPGIYWTPFVDWAKNPNRLVEGTINTYYKDIYLYANGKPQEIAGAYAIDPTHPATKKRIDLYIQRFLTQGFTFLKLDFMSHGALEADAHYDPNVFTGIQAYNQGLEYIKNLIAGRMFLNLSIAPLFPAQYAHSRRIACDAYSSINDTEYTLNSLTYGWWLDHVYSYNDADNVVLYGVTNGENRARVTSSVITGVYCTGDNFSSSGSSLAKLKAETFLVNPEVNRIAKLSKAFYPVETGEGTHSANVFTQIVADTVYLAVFNFNSSTSSQTIDLKRLNLSDDSIYIAHEVWGDTKDQISNSISVSVPRYDVKLFKIYKLSTSEIKTIKEQNNLFTPNPVSDKLYLNLPIENISKISIFDIKGSKIFDFPLNQNSLNLENIESGFYFVSVTFFDGNILKQKIIKN
jgi:alpha-galactosidase